MGLTKEDNKSNILDFVESLATPIGSDDLQASVELRRNPYSVPDAVILMTNRRWASSPSASAILDRLACQPEITSIRHAGQRITLRLVDWMIGSAGEQLEAGNLNTSDLLAGKNYIVDFCDPNATKALHVGHMRNIALGNALAAALHAAGAQVIRQSVICDIGRNVAEAMAGYRQFHNGETPELSGTKSDHFVGRCYAEYVQSLDTSSHSTAGPDAPLAREIQADSDLAQALLAGWLLGEEEPHNLWKTIRTWALDGQDQTLRRLGITIDVPLYESDIFDTVSLLLSEGLERGLFRRTPDGTVLYDTGKEEYGAVPLIRSDDFPTEHMRAIAIWYRRQKQANALDGVIHIMGDEWLAATHYWEDILRKFPPCPTYQMYSRVPYGMVYLQGSKMKSSGGDAILIDQLLDYLAESREVRNLSGFASAPDAETIAQVIALGFFLNRPAPKSVEFSWDRILDETTNPGWLLARAWSGALTGARHCSRTDDVSDASYRFAVIQSHRFRRMLHLTVSHHDVSILMNYLIHMAEWYLTADPNPQIHAIMRTVLRCGLCALGCLPPEDRHSQSATECITPHHSEFAKKEK